MDDPTATYYKKNATGFFQGTVDVDMAPLYDRFLPLIPADGHILDAGCGSGRDARVFRDRGYRVTAFDASAELTALATDHTGIPVFVLRFQDLNWERRFDAIWACASLLHIPPAELADALRRLANALKPTGILYASFKYGQGEREHKGRRFTDLDEQGLVRLLTRVERLEEVDTWITVDRRPDRADERWLNTLSRATGDPWPGT